MQSNVYGLIGRHISLIRIPDLNLVDAVWVANDNNYDSASAVRCNVVLASRDPFAVDWYASEYVLRPVVPDDQIQIYLHWPGREPFAPPHWSIRRRPRSTWVGTYPFVDFVEGYSGNTPLPEEKNQMNVFLASASGKGPCQPSLIRFWRIDPDFRRGSRNTPRWRACGGILELMTKGLRQRTRSKPLFQLRWKSLLHNLG